ncbi:MAG: hypothetical protein PUI29_10195 [Aeromonadales bacterium]|nr:hypothetical protein [Aeromonadales bacterium]
MGLFKKLRNKENEKIESVGAKKSGQSPYNVKFLRTYDGKMQVEFYEKNPKYGQFYDTTRLILDGEQLNILGHKLQKCKISWYGQDDTIMFDKKTGKEMGRSVDYREILTEIDENMLMSDSNYCEAVMKKLLNMKRVTEKLNNGLQENPDVPCGNYVGCIKKTENGYQKFFARPIGEIVHNSQEMKEKRLRYREQKEKYKQQEIDRRKEEIKKIQNEIDQL